MSRYDEIPLADGEVRIRELRRLLEKIDPRRRAGIVKLIAREEALADVMDAKSLLERTARTLPEGRLAPERGDPIIRDCDRLQKALNSIGSREKRRC